MSSFKFELNSKVALSMSREHGEVVGRAEYTVSENSYFVRYVAGDGRQVEEWLGESAIRPVGSMPKTVGDVKVDVASQIDGAKTDRPVPSGSLSDMAASLLASEELFDRAVKEGRTTVYVFPIGV